MIVSTGKLAREDHWGYFNLDNRHGNGVVCCRILARFFNIPKGTAYWMEVSDTRQHGDWVGGEVRLLACGVVDWRVGEGKWHGFFFTAERFLRRHFKLTKKPKRLWCRLLYE